MSRNASGTYSLPNVAVVTGTAITATDENATRNDLATEMTDSLSRSGKGGMLSGKQLILDTGAVGAPAIAFLTDTGSGLYRIGSNDIGFAINGAKVMEWTASATTIVQPLTTSSTLTVTGALTASSTANVVGNFSVATNKFNVTAASGNTTVAGTMVVTGATTLTAAATLTGGFTVGAAVTISAGSNKVTNVTDPTSAQDAATKAYVDASPGLKAWAVLTCGGAGTVTVTRGFNVASASYAGSSLTVVYTSNLASASQAGSVGANSLAGTPLFTAPTTGGCVLFKVSAWTNAEVVSFMVVD